MAHTWLRDGLLALRGPFMEHKWFRDGLPYQGHLRNTNGSVMALTRAMCGTVMFALNGPFRVRCANVQEPFSLPNGSIKAQWQALTGPSMAKWQKLIGPIEANFGDVYRVYRRLNYLQKDIIALEEVRRHAPWGRAVRFVKFNYRFDSSIWKCLVEMMRETN